MKTYLAMGKYYRGLATSCQRKSASIKLGPTYASMEKSVYQNEDDGIGFDK